MICSQDYGERETPLGLAKWLFVDELEQFLAGGRLELLEIDRAVIVRVGGFELLLDDSQVLFLVQRAVIIRIGGLDLRLGEPALELFGVELPIIVRVYFLEHLERAGIGLRQVDRPIIVGIERLERCQAKAPRPLPSEKLVLSRS